MVNEFCAYQCPHRAQHYLHNSGTSGRARCAPSSASRSAPISSTTSRPPGDLHRSGGARLHDEYGIGYFKIVGRGVAFQTVLEAYAYYLVRPEYREDAKRMVMRAAGRSSVEERLVSHGVRPVAQNPRRAI
ncbi:MAG: hypothetical protein ACLT98_07370 [Eggerthellaceae bacterium]